MTWDASKRSEHFKKGKEEEESSLNPDGPPFIFELKGD